MLDFLTAYPELEVKLSMDFPEALIKKFEQHEIVCLIMPEHLVPAFADKKELHSEYYQNNKAKIKKYYENNFDKINERKKQYWNENRD